jgi:putative ABC transport system permease protein
VSLGLASQAVVESEEVDYWIVPEGSETESVVVSSGGVKLGNVHAVSQQIAQDDRVEYATPVFVTLLPVQDAVTGERTYVLTVGVIPAPGMDILGLPADPLTPGDPHYANGSYDGPMTHKVVVDERTAARYNLSTGDTLHIGGTLATAREHEFTVVGVSNTFSQFVGTSTRSRCTCRRRSTASRPSKLLKPAVTSSVRSRWR